MTQSFDAYHVWLGIPPEEQPPNYYRLLGIRTFENNPDVISGAADRQMSHVRTFQSGAHVERAAAILNEISAARLCLLDAAKRSQYDKSLRAARERPIAPAKAIGASVESKEARPPLPEKRAAVEAIPQISSGEGRTRSGRRSAKPLLIVGVALGGIVIVGLIGVIGWAISNAASPTGPQVDSTRPPNSNRDRPAVGASVVVLQGHQRPITHLEFSSDGRWLVSCSGSKKKLDTVDNTVRVWDVEKGRESAVIDEHSRQVCTATFSPDGQRILSAALDGTILLWDWQRETEVSRVRLVSNGRWRSAFFDDAAATCTTASPVGEIGTWDLSSDHLDGVFRFDLKRISGVRHSTDGRFCAGHSDVGNVWHVWNIASQQQVSTIDDRERGAWLGFDLYESGVARYFYKDGSMTEWDATSGDELRAVDGLFAFDNYVPITFAVSSDGKTLATGGGAGGRKMLRQNALTGDDVDYSVRLWSMETGDELHRFEGHASGVTQVAFSASNNLLASADRHHVIRIWRLDAKNK